jgi:hypothetical protein
MDIHILNAYFVEPWNDIIVLEFRLEHVFWSDLASNKKTTTKHTTLNKIGSVPNHLEINLLMDQTIYKDIQVLIERDFFFGNVNSMSIEFLNMK